MDDRLEQRLLRLFRERLEPEGAQGREAVSRQERNGLCHGPAPSVVLRGKPILAELLEARAIGPQQPAERRKALVLRQASRGGDASVGTDGLIPLPGLLEPLRLAQRGVRVGRRHLGAEDGQDGQND